MPAMGWHSAPAKGQGAIFQALGVNYSILSIQLIAPKKPHVDTHTALMSMYL